MEDIQQPKINNILAYVLVAFLAVFIGSGAFLIINNNKSKLTSTELPTPVVQPTSAVQFDGPSLSIQSKNNKVAVSTEFSLDLVADSKDKNIVGYDILLSYDPAVFEFIRADSLLSDYKIYTDKKDGSITLTATKDLQGSTSSFNSTKIARLFFKPSKIGQYNFSLQSSLGNEKTDLITDTTEVLIPSLNDLIINVE